MAESNRLWHEKCFGAERDENAFSFTSLILLLALHFRMNININLNILLRPLVSHALISLSLRSNQYQLEMCGEISISLNVDVLFCVF